MAYLIGVDIRTSGTKTVLFNTQGIGKEIVEGKVGFNELEQYALKQKLIQNV